MAENITTANLKEGTLDGQSVPSNGTAAVASAWAVLQDADFLLLQLKLLGSSVAIIYLGAHAALRRPPSARPAKDKKPGQKDHDDDDRVTPGLEPSDAVMFPIMAGLVLVGLYYLIQWMKDPQILNKILRWYMSIMSIASMMSLYAHGIELSTSLVFPTFWRGRDGQLRVVDQRAETVKVCDDVGNPREGAEELGNPLPGPLACLTRSERARKTVWKVRAMLTRQWVVKLFIHGMGTEKGKIKLAHVLAMLLSPVTALIYSSTSSPELSNMLGYGTCYGSLLLISPTNFLTGSLVLVGLFFYDIVMVFYTPYMITVATKLEVPVKLTFETADRKSFLGLGDIFIPGMVCALALRLDLWLHYARKIKYEATDLQLVEKDAMSGQVSTTSEVKHKEIKARYVNVKGRWGDRLWIRGTMFLSRPAQLPPVLEASRFPKPYFYASMLGYALGMLFTLAMLVVFKHGQPALLYLVPGVLGSLWLTAWVRGEVTEMWKYTEDGSIDTEDVVVDLDGDGKAIKTLGKLENGVVDLTKKDGDDTDQKDKHPKDKQQDDAADKKSQEEKTSKSGHKVFLLSIEVPPEDDDAQVSDSS